MKKLGLSFLFILSLVVSFAQAPNMFKYQAVARDNAGEILANQAVSFEISILQNSVGGTIVYKETHAITTNQHGLANLNIGGGAVVTGDFSTIDWGGAPHFIQVKMDPAGGSAYVLMGTSQLLSVPYALNAKEAESIDWSNIENVPADIADGDNSGDADTDPLNEIQILSEVGGVVTLSNGGGTFVDNDTDGQTLSISGSSLTISGGNTVTLPSGGGTDSQTLSISGNNLTISGGNTVTLPSGGGTDSQTLSLTGSTLSISGGNSISLSGVNTDSQTLSVSGTNLTIAGGNTVALPSSTTGQMSTSVYGTSQATALITTTTYTLVPGLTQTITVPANCRVIISTDGGIQCAATGVAFAAVDIGIHVDGVASPQGGQKEIIASNTDAVGYMVAYWSMSKTYNLSAGSHTIDVRYRDAGVGTADAYVSGTDPLIQGTLTVTIINM